MRSVRLIQNTWIPLADGCRLATRIWLPEDAERNPVPALLEYIPYRKSDWTAAADAVRHEYLARHGYASVRVDIRGSGDSDGILRGKYLAQEQDDAIEVLEWLASQPWCTGSCGMFGLSWGGMSALQVAARRPRPLKAIITLCSTDDRYAEDVHFAGGSLLALHTLSWPTMMLAFNSRPPDPEVVGERWREMWFERMEKTPPFIEAPFRHQRRDQFWTQGSVCEDYDAIECPVYAVGGWADAFRNSVFRLLEHLTGPKKGLIGPWGHQYPDDGQPGPGLSFLPQSIRWWDYWLKGLDTQIMDEPMLHVWIRESVGPARNRWISRGRWASERSWPPPNTESRIFSLSFSGKPPKNSADLVGFDAGSWCSFGIINDFPADQQREDAFSQCCTSAPLPEPLELLGFPEVRLTLVCDRPEALIAVRLCEVFPSGASALITRGLLNLTHRDSHEYPRSVEIGTPTDISIRLDSIGHAFAAGNRLRVAVSSTYWPWTWPTRTAVEPTILAGRLLLPIRRSDSTASDVWPPGEAVVRQQGPRADTTCRRSYFLDDSSGTHRLFWDHDPFRDVARRVPGGLQFQSRGSDEFEIVPGDPLSATTKSSWIVELQRGRWAVRSEATGIMTSDSNSFHVRTTLECYEGGTNIFGNEWAFTFERDHV